MRDEKIITQVETEETLITDVQSALDLMATVRYETSADRMILPKLSGSTGEVIGKVTRIDEAKGYRGSRTLTLQVGLQAAVKLGDRLRLYEERSGDRKSFSLRALTVKGKHVDQAQSGQTALITLADIEPSLFRQPSHGLLFRIDVSGRAENQRSALTRSAAKMPPKIATPPILKSIY